MNILMIKKIKTKLKRSDENGIFHSSKRDVETLMKVCNELINKVNELTDEVNSLKKEESH